LNNKNNNQTVLAHKLNPNNIGSSPNTGGRFGEMNYTVDSQVRFGDECEQNINGINL